MERQNNNGIPASVVDRYPTELASDAELLAGVEAARTATEDGGPPKHDRLHERDSPKSPSRSTAARIGGYVVTMLAAALLIYFVLAGWRTRAQIAEVHRACVGEWYKLAPDVASAGLGSNSKAAIQLRVMALEAQGEYVQDCMLPAYRFRPAQCGSREPLDAHCYEPAEW